MTNKNCDNRTTLFFIRVGLVILFFAFNSALVQFLYNEIVADALNVAAITLEQAATITLLVGIWITLLMVNKKKFVR